MKTEILKICTPDDHPTIQKAAGLLDAGSLVAFPTETVYGIGCKVGPETFARLDEIKGRHPDKRYTLHIGSSGQLTEYIPSMGFKARKLVQNALPGPVTVVFELDDSALDQIKQHISSDIFELLYSDRTLGVRYPDCPVTCAILKSAASPVVAPSANPAGLAPAVSAAEVQDYFNGKIKGIVEIPGFETDLKKSSTVVKIGNKGIEILREGAISADQIRKWTTIQILFVCTGNTCRSPMAEAYCKKYFANNLSCEVDELERLGFIIKSAGIAAYEGAPPSGHAVDVCEAQQIDLSCHQSHQLTAEDIQQSDAILTMSRSHRDRVLQIDPLASEKCFLLDEKSDILDPIGFGIEVYQDCFQQICSSIEKRKKEFL
jgi:protein-tyrosine phosphatase